MENQNHAITCRDALQAALVQQTLASWRFILLFSAPPLIWGLFIAAPGVAGFFIVFLCGVIWIGCWRLWLDECYFRLINKENNEIAGDILHFIWQRESLQHRPFADRQRGALALFRHTVWFTGGVWIVWLIVGLCGILL